MLKRICVFCGSNPGGNGAYVQAAGELGRLLAQEGIGIVYGGGITGVMGALADAALAAGGEVIGVIPEAMTQVGVAHYGVTELRVVDSMHTRKATMAQLCDGFIALPGGLGTLDELFETLTWSQLGYQRKPIGILNAAGYFDPLIDMIDHAIGHGFMPPVHRQLFVVADQARPLLAAMQVFAHPGNKKWMTLPPE